MRYFVHLSLVRVGNSVSASAPHIKALVETENGGLQTCILFEFILPSAFVKLYSAGLDASGNLRRSIAKKGNIWYQFP